MAKYRKPKTNLNYRQIQREKERYGEGGYGNRLTGGEAPVTSKLTPIEGVRRVDVSQLQPITGVKRETIEGVPWRKGPDLMPGIQKEQAYNQALVRLTGETVDRGITGTSGRSTITGAAGRTSNVSKAIQGIRQGSAIISNPLLYGLAGSATVGTLAAPAISRAFGLNVNPKKIQEQKIGRPTGPGSDAYRNIYYNTPNKTIEERYQDYINYDKNKELGYTTPYWPTPGTTSGGSSGGYGGGGGSGGGYRGGGYKGGGGGGSSYGGSSYLPQEYQRYLQGLLSRWNF